MNEYREKIKKAQIGMSSGSILKKEQPGFLSTQMSKLSDLYKNYAFDQQIADKELKNQAQKNKNALKIVPVNQWKDEDLKKRVNVINSRRGKGNDDEVLAELKIINDEQYRREDFNSKTVPAPVVENKPKTVPAPVVENKPKTVVSESLKRKISKPASVKSEGFAPLKNGEKATFEGSYADYLKYKESGKEEAKSPSDDASEMVSIDTPLPVETSTPTLIVGDAPEESYRDIRLKNRKNKLIGKLDDAKEDESENKQERIKRRLERISKRIAADE